MEQRQSALTVTIGIYDMKTGDKALLTVDAAGQSLSSASNPEFAASFSGSVRISSNIDVNNNRYNCYINFSNVEPKATASDRYITLKVEGNPGQTAYIYGSSTITFSKSGLKGGMSMAIPTIRSTTAHVPKMLFRLAPIRRETCGDSSTESINTATLPHIP